MAKKKFYAVRQGRKTGMFLTWDECKKQVMGYPGAIYKSFGTEEEAKEYLGKICSSGNLLMSTCREVIRQQVRWKSTLMEAIMQARKNFPTGWWF